MMTPLSHLAPPLPYLPLPQTYAPWPVWSDSTTAPIRFQADAEEGRRAALAPGARLRPPVVPAGNCRTRPAQGTSALAALFNSDTHRFIVSASNV